MPFRNKTILITGASRGIGKAIALRLAADGANIVIAAKTIEPNPKLEGTIYSAAQEIEQAGGKALPLMCDVRAEDQVEEVIRKAVRSFGGIDVLVNNASAINLGPIEQTEPKRFDLMQQINVRGTFFMSKACIPWLRKADNPHILTMSPPIDLNPKWFAQHAAYTMSKYGMSMTVLGLSAELRKDGIAANALWPATTIATAAVQNLLGGREMIEQSRTPEIVAEAAYIILERKAQECTGNFFIDEEVLREEGITDFSPYAVDATQPLKKDLFL